MSVYPADRGERGWRLPEADLFSSAELGPDDHTVAVAAPPAGLKPRQQAVILAGCAAVVLAVFVFVLSARGHLSGLRPGGGGSRTASRVSLTDSFREAFQQLLAHQKDIPMRLNRLRCGTGPAGRLRCEALTQVDGSGEYPAQFDVWLVGRNCWEARPVQPNIIKATIKGCA